MWNENAEYWQAYEDLYPPMKVVVSVSSGVSSAIAMEQCLARWGGDVVEGVFCDTQWEDDDNYRFLNECDARWQREYNAKPVKHIVEGRTPLQVAEDEHIIPNQKIAPCTKRLKIIPFVNHIKSLRDDGYNVIIAIGMNWTDKRNGGAHDRTVKPRKNYARLGCITIYPLISWDIGATDSGYFAQGDITIDPLQIVKAWGIEPPRMYRLGYKHANCGGRCVKQGMLDWKRTLTNWPERYADVEAWEAEQRKDPVLAPYAFLRDQTGGELSARTLADLRQMVAETKPGQLRLLDFELEQSGCSLECGAGDPEEAISELIPA